MSKKNRFSMLEINNGDQSSEKMLNEKNPTPNEDIKKKPVKEVKTIIPNKEFEENLKKHKLKEQVKDLHLKKQVIQSNIIFVRKMAWIKISIGILIVAMVFKKYIFKTRSINIVGEDKAELIINKNVLTSQDIILIILVVVFTYLMFFYKDKKEK